MRGTYKAIDIANYIISYSLQNKYSVTNLKVQKIMYYIQAAFLLENRMAFDENIRAWRYGPVIKSVYDGFKIYGSREITKVKQKKDMVIEGGKIEFIDTTDDYKNIDIKDKELIDKVLKKQMQYNSYELVDRTHEEYPWKVASRCSNDIIQTDLIKSYFNVNKERIYDI